MNRFIFTLGFFTIILGSSCASLNKTNKEITVTEGNSRFIVSFFSPGNGIDRKAKAKFLNFLENYKPQINYTTAKWGREGEVDFCFDLTELGVKKQMEFITSSKELLSESKKVNFYENKVCRETK